MGTGILTTDFGRFLAKHVLGIGLPWQQLRSIVTKSIPNDV